PGVVQNFCNLAVFPDDRTRNLLLDKAYMPQFQGVRQAQNIRLVLFQILVQGRDTQVGGDIGHLTFLTAWLKQKCFPASYFSRKALIISMLRLSLKRKRKCSFLEGLMHSILKTNEISHPLNLHLIDIRLESRPAFVS